MIYVMSDIHGSRRRFDAVMEQIKLTDEDTLYILGDVIDRGEHGVELFAAHTGGEEHAHDTGQP